MCTWEGWYWHHHPYSLTRAHAWECQARYGEQKAQRYCWTEQSSDGRDEEHLTKTCPGQSSSIRVTIDCWWQRNRAQKYWALRERLTYQRAWSQMWSTQQRQRDAQSWSWWSRLVHLWSRTNPTRTPWSQRRQCQKHSWDQQTDKRECQNLWGSQNSRENVCTKYSQISSSWDWPSTSYRSRESQAQALSEPWEIIDYSNICEQHVPEVSKSIKTKHHQDARESSRAKVRQRAHLFDWVEQANEWKPELANVYQYLFMRLMN